MSPIKILLLIVSTVAFAILFQYVYSRSNLVNYMKIWEGKQQQQQNIQQPAQNQKDHNQQSDQNYQNDPN